jgi:hypothetical protein
MSGEGMSVEITAGGSGLSYFLYNLAGLARGLADTLDGFRAQVNQVPGAADLLDPSAHLAPGTLSGQGTTTSQRATQDASAATTVFTIDQQTGSGFTPVKMQLTAAGRRLLAKSGEINLKVSLTFTPTHGAVSRFTGVIALRASPPTH